MIFLDMRTIIFSYVLTTVVCMVVILLLWQQSRKRFEGVGFFVFNFALQTTALFLIILRGGIPDWMSFVLANTLVIAGGLLGYMGLERFVGKKSLQTYNYVLLAIFVFIHTYYTFVQPDQAIRNLNSTVGLFIICFQCAWLLLYRVNPGMRQLTRGVGIVFGAYCLVSLIRIIEYFTASHLTSDYLQSGRFEQIILVSNQMLFILLTYSLVLMFNKRLLLDVMTQEEKFSKAFHSSPYAITLTRLVDGRIIEANEGFESMTGYQYADIIGKTTIDLHLWGRDEDRAFVVDKLVKGGKVHELEFALNTMSGEGTTGLFSAEIITINNEKCILSSINDITKRKQTESQKEAALEALRESEKRYRSLIENANEGIYVALDGMIKLINRAALGITGYAEEEIISKPFIEFIHPEDREIVRERNVKRLGGEELEPRFKFRFITRGGGIKWLELGGALIDFEGRPATLNVVTDVTERNRAEEALRLSEDKYRSIFENSMEGIYQITPEGQYISVNPALARMMGYESPEDLMTCITDIGRQVFVNNQDSKEFRRIIEEEGTVNSFEAQVYRKDGSTKWVSSSAHTVKDSAGKIARFDGTVQDITERKRDEEEITRLHSALEQKIAERTEALHNSQLALLNLVDDLNQSSRGLVSANQAMNAVNKELASFSYSVSHDLRAPLRSIDGFSQALLEDCADKLDDDGKKYLDRIRQATQNMGRLIDDMLNLSRVTQSEFREGQVDLSKMVHEIADTSQQDRPLNGLTFNIQRDIVVLGDQRLIHIALTNLLENALKFSGKQEHPHIEFGAIVKDGKRIIFVQDNGVGFDMKYAGKLFGAFQRLHRADEFPGTGIGLATVMRVINRHGGQIWAESEIGKGTTFFFTLPEE